MLPRKGRKANATGTATQPLTIEPHQEPTLEFASRQVEQDKAVHGVLFTSSKHVTVLCYCTADRRLCFHCTDSTIPLLVRIVNFQLFRKRASLTVQAGLCRT